MNKYKLILKKSNESINTVEDWKALAPPKKKDKHWKDGRSAKELAKYMIKSQGYLPIEIEKILDDINFNENISFIGEPEAITELVGRGEGRNHDILINGENKIIIGIEAKADEKFGDKISEEFKKLDITDNKIKRIISLYKDVYGTDNLQEYDSRYQLLTATVGTLIEAEKVHADKAILLIISFINDTLNQKKVENNKLDIQYFVNSISKYRNGDKYNLSGYRNIDFYLKSIYVNNL